MHQPGAPARRCDERDARIVRAGADQLATRRQADAFMDSALRNLALDAQNTKAEAPREGQIKQAGYQAEVDRAHAEASQAASRRRRPGRTWWSGRPRSPNSKGEREEQRRQSA